MKTYTEMFKDAVAELVEPTNACEFIAYKKGETRRFPTVDEARAWSALYEMIDTEEYTEYLTKYEKLSEIVYANWYTAIKEHYMKTYDINEMFFTKCFHFSYVMHHAYGNDEVAHHLGDIIAFALDIR